VDTKVVTTHYSFLSMQRWLRSAIIWWKSGQWNFGNKNHGGLPSHIRPSPSRWFYSLRIETAEVADAGPPFPEAGLRRARSPSGYSLSRTLQTIYENGRSAQHRPARDRAGSLGPKHVLYQQIADRVQRVKFLLHFASFPSQPRAADSESE
jgi:hypothetical protein